MENEHFLSVRLYKPTLELSSILSSVHTHHFDDERLKRFEVAERLNNGAPIDASFLVDKGHPHGPEIHCVSKNAVIFILNERTKRFITVLLARPNQVKRLYKECGLQAPRTILKIASYYKENNLNTI